MAVSLTYPQGNMAKNMQTQDLETAKKQFDEFDQSVKDLTNIRQEKVESEPNHQLSQRQIANSKDIYLKPIKTIADSKPFDEKYREEYEFYKEYVSFIAEHKEIIGEKIETWTKKFRGVPAEYWEVPSNKVVWGPRYLAEQLSKCSYRRLKTEDKPVEYGQMGTITGALVVDQEIQRIDAVPVNKGKRSVFMGA
jgi:hypothetical protein